MAYDISGGVRIIDVAGVYQHLLCIPGELRSAKKIGGAYVRESIQ
jgi:hypothetical protein